MRLTSFAPICCLACCLVATPPAAQDKSKAETCADSSEVVLGAIAARQEGVSKRAARRDLRAALDRTAGDMLADWLWELPEDQLGPEIAKAWEAQCLAQ